MLERVRLALTAGGNAAIGQAIAGEGGIGKTQTAVEYAYRHREEYEAVFWIRSDTETNLAESLVHAARLLGLSEAEAQDTSVAVKAALRWLEQNPGWLLIYDNADDPAILTNFLPRQRPGHLLITTRSSTIGKLARRIPLEQMEEKEGVVMLLRRAGIENPLEADISAALELAHEMDSLPLALDQAGAYIEEMQVSPQEYLKLYREQPAELLGFESAVVPPDHASVAKTFNLSLVQVEKLSKGGANLVRLCAFLAPDAIPEELFRVPPERKTAWRKIVGHATRYSLLKRDSHTHSLSIHRLAQLTIRSSMDEPTQREWVERTVGVIHAIYPDPDEIENWRLCERLTPHTLACIDWIEQIGLATVSAAWLANSAGIYLRHRARYPEAERCYRLSNAIRENMDGPGHVYTAVAVHNLAKLHYHQGRYAEAEHLYLRALEILEKSLDSENPMTAILLENLALVYQAQSRYAEGGSLLRRALAIRETRLGPSHPQTAVTLLNLAIACDTESRQVHAEELYKQALSVCENTLASNHPFTAMILYNLAGHYGDRGMHADAESLYQHALAMQEEVLGLDHPDTVETRRNLALLLEKTNRPEEAAALRAQNPQP